MIREWSDELQSALIKEFGTNNGPTLFTRYQTAFPSHYQENTDIQNTIIDINKLENTNDVDIYFYIKEQADQATIHIKIYQTNDPISLSDLMPIFENLGLHAISQECYKVKISDNTTFTISDFVVRNTKIQIANFNNTKDTFENTLIDLIKNQIENDAFNKLIIAGEISYRKVNILRAYARYLKQIKYRYTFISYRNNII